MTVSIQGIPASIQNVIQDETLDRTFHDALFPRMLFRMDATPDRWAANVGDVQVFTRPGLMAVDTAPIVQPNDPQPGTYDFEQWRAEASQYGKPIDTHIPTSGVALASVFLRNTHQLGLNAGQTMDRITRNRLMSAYLGGNTVAVDAAGAAATSINVASINGFTEALQNGKPLPVSAINPLAVTIDSVANTVIGAVPLNAAAPLGRGTLLLGTPLAAPIAARVAVLSDSRARIVRVGGGATIDGIGAGNVLTLQDIINAVARLRAANVPPHPDGYYHAHISPEAEAQLFQDQQFRDLFQGQPDHPVYRDLLVAQLVGCRFLRNTEVPNRINSGGLVSTGTNALVSTEVGAEVLNETAREVRRVLITGMGSVVEKYIDESAYITEAGVTGKVGSFSIVNNGLQVMTERVRLTIRAPLDRLQQVVSQAWSWSGDFAVPSDSLTYDGARFKRAVVIEHA